MATWRAEPSAVQSVGRHGGEKTWSVRQSAMGDSRRASILDILRGRNKESKRDQHQHQPTIERWDTARDWPGPGTILLLIVNFSFRLTVSSQSQSQLRWLSLSSVQLFTYLFNVATLDFCDQISMKFIIIKCSQLMKTIYGTKTLKDLMRGNKILLRTNLWKSNQIQPRLGCLVNCVKYISDHSRI